MGYIYKITNKINSKAYIGQTRFVAEIKGWVMAEGYEVYIKPQCYAACAIANMLTK